MITLIMSVAAGNALQAFITPAIGWKKWRVLRKSSDSFTGYNDPAAVIVSENDFSMVTDVTGLANKSQYFYRDYGWNGTSWVDSGTTAHGTPDTNYIDQSVDVLSVIRERLNLGLQNEIASGVLFHDSNKIPVLLATPTFEDTKWPVVTLHVAGDNSSGNQFIGGLSDCDHVDIDTGITGETDGWLSQYQIMVAAWSINADERAELKKALKRLVIANLPVFEAAGFMNIEVSQAHVDDMQSYPAPVYRVETTLTFIAQSSILINYRPITAANVAGITNGDTYA